MSRTYVVDASFDGGDLDCGNGLLLLIRKHIDPLPRGGVLEILSREITVAEDLPAWCRMTGNAFLSDETRRVNRTSVRHARNPRKSRQTQRPFHPVFGRRRPSCRHWP